MITLITKFRKPQKTMKKGFTLIELLIVISLLGALAVGLLATLDPLEQIRKGNDTGVRNTVSEFQNAAIRYYAIKESFPWGTTAIASSALNAGTMSSYLNELISTGELKADFTTLASQQLSRIYVSATTDTEGVNSVTTCFLPNSKAFQKDPNTIYARTGATDTGCKSQTTGSGGKQCYWCVK